MKTIAITIDDRTLAAIDKLAKRAKPRASSTRARSNRSAVVRTALHEFLARRAQTEQAAEEWRIWSRHLVRVNEQAAALIEEQARP